MHVAIVSEPIDVVALIDRTRTDACGGIAVFLGVARAQSSDDRPVGG
ncbi:MAG: hypothetical protein JOY59_07185, partial [Candidatus Eremiobacteraeota bacterium]|nr:hypothetical protein [Candidatus Eremiobacteraeota bacterium]